MSHTHQQWTELIYIIEVLGFFNHNSRVTAISFQVLLTTEAYRTNWNSSLNMFIQSRVCVLCVNCHKHPKYWLKDWFHGQQRNEVKPLWNLEVTMYNMYSETSLFSNKWWPSVYRYWKLILHDSKDADLIKFERWVVEWSIYFIIR